jgi:phosphate transport system permease protein
MSAIPDPNFSLAPSGNLRRRMRVSRALEWLMTAAAVLAVGVLAIFVVYVAIKGISVISWSFLTGDLPPPTGAAGGMGPALVGTIELVLIGALISVPVGVLTAIYLTEFASPRVGATVRMMLDLMNGIPTIIAGIFAFALLVESTGQQSAIAGSVALSIVMTPLITRTSMEALGRVPGTMREAADALGVSTWRTVLRVILPTAAGGIATATILAVARAAGETAPLILTNTLYGPGYQLNPLHAVPNIPVEIFQLVESGYQGSINQAWGMAFVLLVTILALNVFARVMLRRSERKRGL